MRYVIQYKSQVAKELRRANPVVRQAIVKRIMSLADNPRPDGCTKLQGADNIYRVRQGDYRIMYSVYDDMLIVDIVKIGHRRDIYR